MWLAKNFLDVVIAILCIIILLFLTVKLGLYFINKNELETAKLQLQSIIDVMTKDFNESMEKEYIFINPQNWIFLSSEFGSICNSKFCLCMCNSFDCKDLFVCEPTDKFVFIKNNNKPRRFLYLNQIPISVKVRFVDKRVYPANAEKNIIQINNRELTTGISPIFFIFDDSSGVWKWNDEPSKEINSWKTLDNSEDLFNINKNLLELLNVQADNKQTTFFSEKGFKESKGVFIVEANIDENTYKSNKELSDWSQEMRQLDPYGNI